MKDPFHTTKLTKRIAELKAYRFQKVQDLTMWSAKKISQKRKTPTRRVGLYTFS